jgi:outer membrane protein assembly factor BamE (lipoprotein component of BamABCDE complex)
MPKSFTRSMRAVVVLLMVPLAGCGFLSAHSQVRGNLVDQDQLSQLVPGVSTRADATSVLGSPTAHASFDDNTWLYIGGITRPVIAGTQHLISERTVILTFDNSGILRGIRTTTAKNALPATMIARVTPSPGSNASFMQQVLGNVGKFNSAQSAPTNTVGTAAGNGNGDNGDSSRFSTGQ